MVGYCSSATTGRSRPRSSRSRAWARSSRSEWPPRSKKLSSSADGLDLEELLPDRRDCDAPSPCGGARRPAVLGVSRDRSPSLVGAAGSPATQSAQRRRPACRGDRGEDGLRVREHRPPPWPRPHGRGGRATAAPASPRGHRQRQRIVRRLGRGHRLDRHRSPAGARPRRPGSSGRRRGCRTSRSRQRDAGPLLDPRRSDAYWCWRVSSVLVVQLAPATPRTAAPTASRPARGGCSRRARPCVSMPGSSGGRPEKAAPKRHSASPLQWPRSSAHAPCTSVLSVTVLRARERSERLGAGLGQRRATLRPEAPPRRGRRPRGAAIGRGRAESRESVLPERGRIGRALAQPRDVARVAARADSGSGARPPHACIRRPRRRRGARAATTSRPPAGGACSTRAGMSRPPAARERDG